MAGGQILVSGAQGIYYLKLIGDVRVTLCTSLANYLDTIFSKGDAEEVVVDLTHASGADSTTLGLLTKLAIHCQEQFGITPVMLCTDEGLLRIIDAMSLDEVYDIRATTSTRAEFLQELEQVAADEAEIRERVLEAHRLLIALNPDNQKEFIDLIKTLEDQR